MVELINQILSEIQLVSDYFYQQKVELAYDQLDGILEKIDTISEQLHELSEKNLIVYDDQKMLTHLTTVMEAIEEKDTTFIADILVFDIAGQLLELIH